MNMLQEFTALRRLTLMLSTALLSAALTLTSSPVRAQDTTEAQINALAAALHRVNVGGGGYTDWVGGKLGKRPYGLPKYLVVGEKMPDFALKNFGGVQTVRSRTLKPPYLLNIWASWCPPCRDEFPLLTGTALKGSPPFSIYFVNTSDTQRRANTFLRTQRGGIEVLFDAPPDYAFNDLIGIQVIPDTLLIGADGTLLAIHIGQLDQTALDFFTAVTVNPGVGSYAADGVLQPPKPFQTAGAPPLVSGVQYVGTLNDRNPYTPYTFTGEAGQLITVSMRAIGDGVDDAADPYLVLLNDRGDILSFDDDSGALVDPDAEQFPTEVTTAGSGLDRSAGDALIRAFTLPETGTYTLIVARAGYEDGLNEGTYQLVFVDEGAFF